jgi:molybdate transport system substrate-binding protein
MSTHDSQVTRGVDTAAPLSVGSGQTARLPQNRTLTVYAAASLTDAFQEIGLEFEAANPGVKVDISFAGSQVLRTQLEQGALADIFASADVQNMDVLISENLVASNSSRNFATNRLIVILPPGNPASIDSLDGFGRQLRPGW